MTPSNRRRNYEFLATVGERASDNAHMPFSNYPVGAAVLTATGEVYVGCNVENPGLDLTSHGEMNSINAAIGDGALERAKAAGFNEYNWIDAVAILPKRMFDGWPCCHCCDYMASFGTSMNIVVRRADGSVAWKPLSRLYPNAPDVRELKRLTDSGELLKLRGQGVPFTQGRKLGVVGRGKRAVYHVLLKIARDAAYKSYAPYTKRPAGAAVLLWDGSVYTGVRMENVGYTDSSHPELNAVAAAIADGALERAIAAGRTPLTFIKAIVSCPLGMSDTWPMGAVRQALCDYGLKLDIVVEGKDGSPSWRKLGALFPKAFVPDVLSYWTK